MSRNFWVSVLVGLSVGQVMATMNSEDYDWIKGLSNDSSSYAPGFGQGCTQTNQPTCGNRWAGNLASETQSTLQSHLLEAHQRYQRDADKVEIQPDPSTVHPYQVSNLLVFVSFSMPEQSLKSLAAQVAKSGGYLVLRGLVDNNVVKTHQQIVSIIGEEYAGRVLIDPMMFRQFSIHSVPAFVVIGEAAQPCTERACQTPKHDVVYGNMPLESALLLFSQNGDYPELAKQLHKRVVG